MRLDHTYTYPNDIATMQTAFTLATAVATEFHLQLRVVEHKRRPNAGGALGLCYQREGRISILVRWKDEGQWSKTTVLLPSVLDTTLHELAHLPGPQAPDGLPEGRAHREFQQQLTDWATAQGLLSLGAERHAGKPEGKPTAP